MESDAILKSEPRVIGRKQDELASTVKVLASSCGLGNRDQIAYIIKASPSLLTVDASSFQRIAEFLTAEVPRSQAPHMTTI